MTIILQEHLFELEAALQIPEAEKPLYVIYPDEFGGNWRIQAVPISPESFESRKALPEKWRGVRDDELSKARFLTDRPGTHNGPGVLARGNSVAVPALLPDGRYAEESFGTGLDPQEVEQLPRPTGRGQLGSPDDSLGTLEGAPSGIPGGTGPGNPTRFRLRPTDEQRVVDERRKDMERQAARQRAAKKLTADLLALREAVNAKVDQMLETLDGVA